MYFWSHWGQTMNSFLERRVSIASCWASTRIALLDGIESYEDSYAITQEFREWITCREDYPEELDQHVLKVPVFIRTEVEKEIDTDEVLGI